VPAVIPTESGTLVARDGLIAAIGPDVPVPPDARVLRCTGCAVVAGFWNAHFHFTEGKSELAAGRQPFRLVGHRPLALPGASETVTADLTDRDQTVRSVAGSTLVYLVAGLPYDHMVWEESAAP
jgi:cytosine/adenosine deaminase-related metal-dependent hydrolase